MNMQEMIYKEGRISPVRLADGVYRGVPFYVLSLGTHPCAYVDIAPLGLHAINERDIDCHGGITYHRDHLATVDHEGNFLGWDYAHCMDYSGDLPFLDLGYSKRWTTKEMVAECKNVIDQIVGRTDNGESGIYADAYNDLAEDFHRIPAADVAPVVHGRWEGYTHSRYCGKDEYGEPIYRDGIVYYCSNPKCRRKTVIKENYCPACGAKMDKEAPNGEVH